MRRMTILWLFLAALTGGILYHTSQQVTDGRQRLAVINDDIRKEDETIRVLQAEWSYLNQPDRLERLSKQYLDLAPLKGKQFAKLADVPEQPAAPPAAAAPVAAAAADTTPPAPDVKAAEKAEAIATGMPPVKGGAKPAPKVAKAAIVKIRRPPALPAPRHVPPVATAESAPDRSFSDVIRSLGVR